METSPQFLVKVEANGEDVDLHLLSGNPATMEVVTHPGRATMMRSLIRSRWRQRAVEWILDNQTTAYYQFLWSTTGGAAYLFGIYSFLIALEVSAPTRVVDYFIWEQYLRSHLPIVTAVCFAGGAVHALVKGAKAHSALLWNEAGTELLAALEARAGAAETAQCDWSDCASTTAGAAPHCDTATGKA